MKLILVILVSFLTLLAQSKELNEKERAKKFSENLDSQLDGKSILQFINVRNHSEIVTGSVKIGEEIFKLEDGKCYLTEEFLSSLSDERVEAIFLSTQFISKKFIFYQAMGTTINSIIYVLDKRYPSQIQIVLNWENPNGAYDLDSHLEGNSLHVYYRNLESYGTDGSKVTLNRDITNQNSYELITISRPSQRELYKYTINKYRGDSNWLNQHVTVDVYMDNALAEQYHLTSNNEKTNASNWNVFSVNANGQLTLINTIQ
jgi:hypothetical protein